MVSPSTVTVAVMTPPKPWPLPVRVSPAAAEEAGSEALEELPQAARLQTMQPASAREINFFMIHNLL